jgi:hypothetical protein
MAFLEYLLAVLLATAGAASPGTSARTFTAEAVIQPGGGTESLLAQTGGPTKGKTPIAADTGRKGRSHARRHHKGHTRARVTGSDSTFSSSTGGAGGVKPNMNRQPRPPRPRAAPSNSNKNSK